MTDGHHAAASGSAQVGGATALALGVPLVTQDADHLVIPELEVIAV
jgi:hypothetical protein